MTIDAVHGSVEAPHIRATDGVAIGSPDANIFLCPRCTRPLAVGASRCAGCRTRLVAGVPVLKVTGFVGLGLLAGLAFGGGTVGALTVLGGHTAAVAPPVAAAPSPAVVASAAASGVPVASGASAPSAVPADPAVPAPAVTALRRSTTVNQRLLVGADLLGKALATRNPSPADIAPLLRSLGSTASFGDGIATTVGTWDEAASLSTALASFYSSIDRIAQDALTASITNERAYRDAGTRMLAVLDRLTQLDADTRALAAKVDVELPPLTPANS
jgi:hypothetical protein